MQIEYRAGTPQDLEELVPLVEAFAREQQKLVRINEFAPNFVEVARSSVAQALEHPAAVVMVAEEKKEDSSLIVGYAVGLLQEPPALFKPDPYVFVSDLYVFPKYRRRGIGTALLERVRGWGFVKNAFRFSAVLPVGSAAQGLFERMGFRAIQTMVYADDRETRSSNVQASGKMV